MAVPDTGATAAARAAGFVDALGTRHARAGADARIACLVPSITELLCALGLADRLVARTGFCIHPRELVADIPKVGGTKDVDLARLAALAPTHVIVNIDENEKPTVDAIARFVPNVIVTHPNAPHDNLALYDLLGGIFGREAAAAALGDALKAALGAALGATAGLPRENVLYLIWQDPWMTVGPDTYISRTLAAVGWDTVAARDGARYPVVDLIDAARDASLVLLSTEPFMFREAHAAAVQAQLDARYSGKRTILVDGEMTSWYGNRAIEGLSYLTRLRAACYKTALQRSAGNA